MSDNACDTDIIVDMIDDDRSYLEMISEYINLECGMKKAAFCHTKENVVSEILAEAPDVLLVGVNANYAQDFAFISEIKLALPTLPILILSSSDDSDVIFQAFRLGASGYLLKREIFSEISKGIRQIHRGGAPMTSVIARKVTDHFRTCTSISDKADASLRILSNRENQVLQNLARGDAYKMIALELEISIDTVRMHIRSLYQKLGVHSRGEAVAKYFQNLQQQKIV